MVIKLLRRTKLKCQTPLYQTDRHAYQEIEKMIKKCKISSSCICWTVSIKLNISLVTMDFLQLSDSSFSFRLNDFKVVLLSPLNSLFQRDFSLSMMHLSISQTLLFLNCPKNPFSPSFSFEKIVDNWLFFSAELIQSFREFQKSCSTFSKHILTSKHFSNWEMT